MATVPSDEEFLAYNQGIISEFRANHGVVSQPPFPILLLTTTGARTGRSTTVPLGFAVDDSGRVFVMASKAGAPRHPAWFHNLRANPSVTVELGDRSFQARAVVTEGEERDRLYGLISDGAVRIREEHRPGLPGHRPRRRPRPRLTTSPGTTRVYARPWPVVTSTWPGTGSCRSPTVRVPAGSNRRSWVGTGAKGRCSTPLGTVNTVPRGRYDGALAGGLAQRDVQLAVDDEEELVGAVVDVPDVLAVDLRDADVVVVDFGDDAGTPLVVEGGKGIGQRDRRCGRGCHEAMLPPEASPVECYERICRTILATAAPGGSDGGRELQSLRDELRDRGVRRQRSLPAARVRGRDSPSGYRRRFGPTAGIV